MTSSLYDELVNYASTVDGSSKPLRFDFIRREVYAGKKKILEGAKPIRNLGNRSLHGLAPLPADDTFSVEKLVALYRAFKFSCPTARADWNGFKPNFRRVSFDDLTPAQLRSAEDSFTAHAKLEAWVYLHSLQGDFDELFTQNPKWFFWRSPEEPWLIIPKEMVCRDDH